MKIGILTFHRAINYGAVFQAYALKEYLKSIGNNVENIDYWPQYHIDEYKIINPGHFKQLSAKGKLKYLLSCFISLSRTVLRRRRTIQFMKDHFDIAQKPKYLLGSDIKDDFDLVVYGSDQIWRKTSNSSFNNFFDSVYFGEYPKHTKKRATYAASMGIIQLTKDEEKQFKNLLGNFDKLSVRENNLQELVKKCGYNSEIVIDPVFLLEKENWNKLIKQKSKKSSPYIFFYHHKPSKEASLLAQQISAELKCKIVEINAKALPFAYGKKYKNTASPSEYLRLIKDAEFVITTSFHGTAFSVLFNKQFYAVGMGNNAERAKTLLQSVDLSSRYLSDCSNRESEPIDYSKVNRKLENIVKYSKDYLNLISS